MNWITNLVGFAKASPIKLGIILSMITSLIAFIMWGYNEIFKAGYNEAKVEIFEQVDKERLALEEEYRLKLGQLSSKLESTKQESQENKDRAVELQGLLEDRPIVEVVREISNIKTECPDLGNEFTRVRNNIIGEEPTLTH